MLNHFIYNLFKKKDRFIYKYGLHLNVLPIEKWTNFLFNLSFLQIGQMIGQDDHFVHRKLKRGERADIQRLISISSYSGIRRQGGLPLPGQRNQKKFLV